MGYHCSQCKMAVIVLGGEVIKACHCEAPIVAELAASLNASAAFNQVRRASTGPEAAAADDD